MAFNATTYRMNQARRDAWARLAEARAIKHRIAVGEAYDWEAARLPFLVSYALISMRLFVSYRRQREIEKGMSK